MSIIKIENKYVLPYEYKVWVDKKINLEKIFTDTTCYNEVKKIIKEKYLSNCEWEFDILKECDMVYSASKKCVIVLIYKIINPLNILKAAQKINNQINNL